MNCKICGGTTTVVDVPKLERFYYKCSYCEFHFLDEKFIITPEDEMKRYQKHNNSSNNRGYLNMFLDLKKEFIDPEIDNINCALDFGCGKFPLLAEILNKNGISTDYYDLYFHPKKLFINKKYDLITSTEVIEHLKNPLEILELFLDHLNDGGYILLMTNFLPNSEDKFLDWWYIRDETHIGFFSLKTFSLLEEKLPLKIIKTNNKNGVLFRRINA